MSRRLPSTRGNSESRCFAGSQGKRRPEITCFASGGFGCGPRGVAANPLGAVGEGAMDAATWDWMGRLITGWRAEADVARAPNLRVLSEVAQRISESGITEGLVAYVVLGCEWLFRARLVKDADVEDVVRRLQEGFAGSLRDPHLAYLVTEVLRPKIEDLVKREARVSVPFGL